MLRFLEDHLRIHFDENKRNSCGLYDGLITGMYRPVYHEGRDAI